MDDTPTTFIDYLFRTLDTVHPVMGAPDTGMGLRASICLTFQTDTDHWYVEIFSEHLVPDHARDMNVGFQPNDFKYFDGVQVMQLFDQTGPHEYGRAKGIVYPFKKFLRRYARSTPLRIKLERKMDVLRQMVYPGDDYCSKLDDIWISRSPHHTSMNWHPLPC